MVAETVAAVLGIAVVMGRPARQALTEFVANRRLLLMLDNCEHLIDAAAAACRAVDHNLAGMPDPRD